MTQDQIIEMAREAGLQLAINAEAYPVITQQLTRFANLVRNAALEEAADHVFQVLQHENMNHCWAELHDAQTQIRALKGTEK